MRDGTVPTPPGQGLVRCMPQRVHQGRADLVGGVQRSVREHLVDICPVRLARVVREALPALLVELGEVSLGVNDVHGVTSAAQEAFSSDEGLGSTS